MVTTVYHAKGSSKYDFRCEFELPVEVRLRQNLAEVGIAVCRVRSREYGMIRDVEHGKPELQTSPFGEVEILLQSAVDVVHAGRPNRPDVRAHIAIGVVRRLRERRGVEVSSQTVCDRPTDALRWISDNIGAAAVGAGGTRCERESEREAALEDG